MFALLPYDFVKYEDGKRFERNLYIYVAKTKVLISCTASLFSDMQKKKFSHDAAHFQLSSEYSFN